MKTKPVVVAIVRNKVALAVFVALSTLALAKGAITVFNAPEAGTSVQQGTLALDITKSGLIQGFYIDSNYARHGFLRTSGGTISSFDVAGARSTFPVALNSLGTSAGYYSDPNFAVHGFRRTSGGGITIFDVAAAGTGQEQGTVAGNINRSDEIAGFYIDASGVNHGFLRAPNGTIVTFDAPGAGSSDGQGTIIPFGCCLNDNGEIAGFYIDSKVVNHGFLRRPGGAMTTFDVPGSGTAGGEGTSPQAINSLGTIVGYYADQLGRTRGFIRASGGTLTTFAVPGATGTFPVYITSTGEITGNYVDLHDVSHGFVRSPTGTITKFDVPFPGVGRAASQGTFPTTENSSGAIAGFYIDSNNVHHGFVRP